MNASRQLPTSLLSSAMRTNELQRGIELFNSGEFLQCHDYLEELIPFESGQAAEFFHGLMELAAACYHLKQGNVFGARYLLTSAIDLLDSCRPSCQGVDVERLVAQIEHCRVLANSLEDDEGIGFDESHLPKIGFGI
jgi:predicted metal-dependent hydrolase